MHTATLAVLGELFVELRSENLLIVINSGDRLDAAATQVFLRAVVACMSHASRTKIPVIGDDQIRALPFCSAATGQEQCERTLAETLVPFVQGHLARVTTKLTARCADPRAICLSGGRDDVACNWLDDRPIEVKQRERQ